MIKTMNIINVKIEDVKRHEVQRDITDKHVQKLVDNFDERLMDPLVAVKNTDGYEVFDGGHRLKVLQQLGYSNAPLNVVGEDLSKEEVLHLFLLLNKTRRPVSPLEQYQVGVIAEDPSAIELEKLLVEFDFDPGNVGETLSVQALNEAKNRGVARDVLVALFVLREQGNESIYSASVIRGIIKFRLGITKGFNWQKFFEVVDMDEIVKVAGRGQVADKIAWALVGLLPAYMQR